MKQALVESAHRVPDANVFEQGMGKINLLGLTILRLSSSFF
jgi:hypothetical protein